MAGYYRTYLPHPGFVATGIHLWRVTPAGNEPLGSIETFAVQGAWIDMIRLRHRVRLIDITGLHLVVPPKAPVSSASPRSRPHQPEPHPPAKPAPRPSGSGVQSPTPQQQLTTSFTGPSTPVDLLRLHESVLDIRRAGGGYYALPIRSLQIAGLQKGHAMHYRINFENPLPHGYITADGTLGPIDQKDFGATPVAGEFTFNPIDLRSIGNLRGSMAATGRFVGRMHAVHGQATAHSSNFAVGDGRPTAVRGDIDCVLNGINGDLFISHLVLSSGQTTVVVHGSVAGPRKVTQVEFAARGRAEDVLRPFLHDQVPVLGPVALHGQAHLDPPGRSFFKRLQVTGSFDVPAEKITNAGTEHTLSTFSQRMENHRPHRSPNQQRDTDPDVLSSLQGPAYIRNGIASSPHLVFKMPGANAALHGTYSFLDGRVHLTGILRMDAGISHATTGWKSVVLKLVSPLFSRKHHPGSKIPIAVLGVPRHYRVTHDLTGNK